MTKPEAPKPNIFSQIVTNLSWVSALLFPKKSKPTPKPSAAPMSSAPSFTPTPHAPAAPSPQAPTASAPVSTPMAVAPTPPPPPTAAPVAAVSPSATKPATSKKTRAPIFQPGKLLPAFWTVASGLSFIVNIILIVTLVILAQQLFALKKLVGSELIGGLYENFILMDQAHIKSNIQVVDKIPVNFNLNISQDTIVTLTEPTQINGAMVRLNSGGLTINSPANITLPAGTNLPVHLELTVPVDASIPITLNVPVDIPLQETELHRPFIGLQGVLSPYYWLLQPDIENTSNIEACQNMMINWFCDSFFVK